VKEIQMSRRVGLVTDEAYVHAWVLDLPGCIVGGTNLSEVEQMLPVAIAEHVTWLRTHGEVIDASGTWAVAESIDSPPGDFCFAGDRAPLDSDELEVNIARMGYARADLLAELEPLPDVILDWEPPASAFASFDPWAPNVRTIRGLARHVFQFEIYYREGLRDGPAKGIFEDVTDPAADRSSTVAALRACTANDRVRIYRPLRPGQSVAEEWTVRKVLRRIISHERAHAAEITQRRTWLLLGLPTVEKG
jgi:predicted RNase H-like HicB family nuclease